VKERKDRNDTKTDSAMNSTSTFLRGKQRDRKKERKKDG